MMTTARRLLRRPGPPGQAVGPLRRLPPRTQIGIRSERRRQPTNRP